MKYLLGATDENELVFADFWDMDEDLFSVRFCTVRPFRENEVDLESEIADYVDTLNDREKRVVCEKYDCRPQELVAKILKKCRSVHDWRECSIHPVVAYVDGEKWLFENSLYGKYDIRDWLTEYADEPSFRKLMSFCEKYQDKKMNSEIKSKAWELRNRLNAVNEKEWVASYIRRCAL